MAVLPTPEDLGRRPSPRPQRPETTINASAMAAPGRAFAQLGQQVNQIGNEMLDRWSTAVARERDAMVSGRIRELMYGENGYMNRRGSNAIGQDDTLAEQLEAIRAEALDGTNNVTRDRLEPAIQSRIDAALGSVTRHGASELQTYERSAREAQLLSAQEDAIANPSLFESSLARTIQTTMSEIAADGLAPEVGERLLSERTTTLYRNEIARLAADDPAAAWDFLEQHEDDMLPSVAEDLRQNLEPIYNEYQGRQAARGIFGAAIQPRGGHGTHIEYRPTSATTGTVGGTGVDYQSTTANPAGRPNEYLVLAVANAVEDVWGEGARVVFTSGARPGGRTGSYHHSAMAADFGVVRPDGTWVRDGDPDAPELEIAAARYGVVGFGRGPEYEMGNSIYHMDWGLNLTTGAQRPGIQVWADMPGHPYEADTRGAPGNYAAINQAWVDAGRPRFDPANPMAVFGGQSEARPNGSTTVSTSGLPMVQPPDQFRSAAEAAADASGIPHGLFFAVVHQESTWRPEARSEVGAFGLTQAMPNTARSPGFGVRPMSDPNDPAEQLRFGADYLRAMLDRYDGDVVRALAAYNWGPGNADNWDGNLASLPQETRDYVNIITTNMGGDANEVLVGGSEPVSPTGPARVEPGEPPTQQFIFDQFRLITQQYGPEAGQAFLDEVETYMTLQGNAAQEQQAAVAFELYNFIEGGGSYYDVPLDQRQNMPVDMREALQEYERDVRRGAVYETDPQTYVFLDSMTDEMLAQQNIFEFRQQLNNEDWRHIRDRYTAARRARDEGAEAAPTVSGISNATLRSISEPFTTVFDDDGRRQTVFTGSQQSVFEYRLQTWQRDFIRREQRAPNEAEAQDQIRRLMTEVVLDPETQLIYNGRDRRQGRMFEFDLNQETPTVDDDVNMRDLADAVENGTFTIGGTEVTADDLQAAWVMAARDLNPGALDLALVPGNPNLPNQPTTQDLVNYLMAIHSTYGQ
jgi:hypothetical protein